MSAAQVSYRVKPQSILFSQFRQKEFVDSLFNIIDLKSALTERKQREMETLDYYELDYFLVSKHQIIEENVLFTSKTLYELLEKEQHIDELFLMYTRERDIILNLNMERILYLSLALLYSLSLIVVNQNMIKRNIK
ncbi:hypothetical protein [Paenibacillus sp. Marseille-P2973]|uniref:hypothetical protein n=1 Tax=Paenibacillus sp. Marseille-P2973 TaxID=1871032 RepID=UPI001FFCBEB4|nr:hypothetical protein [Paenibacillus sp. Marseille-P2973]